ncbi:DUF3492 domain-containing protein, partial [Salmonella enterica]
DELHTLFRNYDRSDASAHSALVSKLGELIPLMEDGGKMDQDTFLFSKRSWDYLASQYRIFCTDPSFVDYFWTVRIMHQPVWT